MSIETINTTKFGKVQVDTVVVRKKRGFNSKVNGLISEIKSNEGVSRLSAEETAVLHMEISNHFLKK